MRGHALAIALALAFPLATALTASPAFAADGDRALALDLFEQGRTFIKSGDYGAALRQFEAAAKVMRTFGILLNIAECQEKLGRTASAWATWREARAVASEAQRPEDERMALEREKGLEVGLSRLTILVSPDADAPDLEVRRDGTAVPREGWSRAIAVDPGPHIIEAHAPGRKSRTLTVSVQGNADSRSVTLTALEKEDTPPAPSVPASVPRPTGALPTRAGSAGGDTSSTGSGQRLAGWILSGLGVAGVGTGIAVAFVGQGQHNDAVATDLAGNLPQAQTMESNANTTKTIGYITIGGGGAFLLTGLVLVLAAPAPSGQTNASRDEETTVTVRPWASAGGGGVLFSKEW